MPGHYNNMEDDEHGAQQKRVSHDQRSRRNLEKVTAGLAHRVIRLNACRFLVVVILDGKKAVLTQFTDAHVAPDGSFRANTSIDEVTL